jgi:O-methyltransferase involved in polyketide biosynthesis
MRTEGVPVDGSDEWRTTFRPDIPSSARIYDYLLGGKDNYQADRRAAEIIVSRLPNARQAVQWNRGFLRRAVRYLVAEAGIRQIIDIGAGLPTAGNTHEVAFEACPDARVVYVDHDPVVLAHARNMLHAVPGTAVIDQDLHSPEAILADPELTALIDFSQPVAFLLLSVLHFVGEEADPAGLIARLHGPFPSGSHVAISHLTPDAIAEVRDAAKVFDRATEQAHVRTRTEIAKLVVGLDMVEPGMVWTPQWRPEPGVLVPANARESYYCAVAARKP